MATQPSTIAHQARTLETAHRRGTTWTQSELDLLTAFAGTDPQAEIARCLERSLYGVMTKHSQVLRGEATPAPAAASGTLATSRRSGEGYKGWVEGMGDGD